MTTLSIGYGTKTAYTTSGIASLASSSSLVAGYQTNEIDNTSTKFDDIIIDGFITTGTTPTINTSIVIYCIAGLVSLGTTAKDVITATAAARTLSSAGTGRGFVKLIVSLDVDTTTTARRYDFGPVSLAQRFGGTLPPFHTLFIVHNTVAALNATAGNHAISYQGINYTNA